MSQGMQEEPTLDLKRRRITRCFHDSPQENGDVGYIAFSKYRGCLFTPSVYARSTAGYRAHRNDLIQPCK